MIHEITLFSLRYNIQLLSDEIRVFIHIKDKVWEEIHHLKSKTENRKSKELTNSS